MPAESPSKTLYLVDGTSQLFRAYYAIRSLTNAEGLPTNAVYGFTTMLRKLVRDENPAYLGVAFDPGGPVFRHEQYAEYKANRPRAPEDLTLQVPYAKQVCEVLGIPVLELKGYEADDVIATFATRARDEGLEVVVVASDKDLLQLVEGGVEVLNPSKNERLDADGVEASFGVRPERVRDVLGLMGDAVDNVPGVPGVGRKTAREIVGVYGDIEAVIERAERFVAAWEARDALVAELGQASEGLRSAVQALARALERLLEVERDEAMRGRLEEVARVLEESDLGTKPARAALKRELKALDRGSAKRAWNSIAEHTAQARLSRGLVTLQRDVPIEFDADRLVHGSGDTVRTRQLFRSLGFTSLVNEIEAEAQPSAPAAPVTPTSYVSILEPDALESLVEACRQAERLAFALYTGAGDALSCPLLGIAVAHAEGRAAYIPLGHAYLGAPDPLSFGLVRESLQPVLAGSPAAAHDLKWVAHVLRRHGLQVDPWGLDTMVAAFLLDPGRSSYPLETLAGEWLSWDVAPPGRGVADAATVAVEEATARWAERADLTWRLVGELGRRLESSGLTEIYETMDGPLLPLLRSMETHGVRIDTELLASMSGEMTVAIDRARREIHDLAGVEFNTDSPKQLREVLFERLGLAPRRKTAKSRAASTDAQTLEELRDEHPIAGRLLEYRELTKLKGTYVDALPRLVHADTGRVHTSYHPTGAATGRLSSSDPNLQNIPVRKAAGRRIREAFIPEDGFLFLSSDYSQIELRVLAHMSGDPELIAAFRAGEDIHRHTAARVFGVLPDLVTDDMRRRAKAVNFGILYGMSAMRLAREQRVPLAEARRFIEAYFERFGRVREYIDTVREQALRDASVRTLFGRTRGFPQLRQRVNRAVREQALRGAVNTTIQGTAADLMKLAMLAVDRELARDGSEARMLLQVHDELLLEVREDAVGSVARRVRRAMEGVYALGVPLVVDQKTGRSWLEVT